MIITTRSLRLTADDPLPHSTVRPRGTVQAHYFLTVLERCKRALGGDEIVQTTHYEMGADIHAGDRVGLVDDDWSLVGHELILVDPEPVPGSSQCVVADAGERITVSRARLRRI